MRRAAVHELRKMMSKLKCFFLCTVLLPQPGGGRWARKLKSNEMKRIRLGLSRME